MYESNTPMPSPRHPVGRKELIAGIFLMLFGLLLTNSIFYGGFNLGFSVCGGGVLLTGLLYLLVSGRRPTFYSGSLLALSLVILAAFARSDDGFVKFVMLCFLFVSVTLSIALVCRQNRRDAKGFRSLADAFRGFFGLGFGGIGRSFRGLGDHFRRENTSGKKTLSILLGLAIALPLLLILVPLLMRADAAFEGIMDKFPEIRLGEIIVTLMFGSALGCFLFSWILSNRHTPAKDAKTPSGKGISSLTVNTVLLSASLVYCLYLISQLAYFSGGFSGLLPEGYTTAAYARRGFFEMAWLCAINLTVIVLAAGLVKKQDRAPLATRLLCLFIGIVTLFLVASASAKMALYIRSYGLTRLRVLTEVIMLFLGFATAILCLWLFMPKLAYMKVILLAGLVMGALVIWADVDTVVARYNVNAYRNGVLESVDVYYLYTLGDSAVPILSQLTEDSDPKIASAARQYLDTDALPKTDLRNWNWTRRRAEDILFPPSE